MMKQMKLLSVLLAAGMAAQSAHADNVTFSFTAGAHSGYFSYDDANITQVGQPVGISDGGTYFAATAFSFDGFLYGDAVIGLFDNALGTFDGFTVSRSGGGYPSLSFTSHQLDTLADASLASLSDVELSDFDMWARVYVSAADNGIGITVTELEQTVPEPTSIALALGALSALAIARRRKVLTRP